MAIGCSDSIFQIRWYGWPKSRRVFGKNVLVITVSKGTFTIRRNGIEQDVYAEMLKTKYVEYEVSDNQYGTDDKIEIVGLPADLILLYIKGEGYADLTLSEYLDKMLAPT